MKKTFLLILTFIFGMVALIKPNMQASIIIEANIQDSILIKHSCKIIEHGFFTFYTFDDDKTIIKNVFGYSLNLKKQTFVVSLIESDTIKKGSKFKNGIDGLNTSEEWNKKRVGTAVEKYFLLFHPDFLKWNNAQKLDFFIRKSKRLKSQQK